MTSAKRRPTEPRRQRNLADTRQSVERTRQAVREVQAGDDAELHLDPASELFFEFAGPLLLTARDQQEFSTAASIAEFVWMATFMDAATQALMLEEFIEETGLPDNMIPWLLDVYDELAARKAVLIGE
ncbi:MAG: hypothetical protein DCC58_15935 [Chloroflexi bacterium]|nr:MAG: hypothetical protein DCC58_15935 [Chloroflexota bacterium]